MESSGWTGASRKAFPRRRDCLWIKRQDAVALWFVVGIAREGGGGGGGGRGRVRFEIKAMAINGEETLDKPALRRGLLGLFPVFPKAEQSESMKERERMSQLQRRDVVIGKAGWSSKGIWIQLGGGRK